MKLSVVDSDLAEWFSNFERVVIVGVGNPLRHDDDAGIELVRRLKEKILRSTILLIESETVPEDFIEPIVEFEPSHILIIDAAIMDIEPGSMKLVEPSSTSEVAISTHMLPIQIFSDYLTKTTKAKIGLLLIQPENVDFGEGLSPKLRVAVERLVDALLRILR